MPVHWSPGVPSRDGPRERLRVSSRGPGAAEKVQLDTTSDVTLKTMLETVEAEVQLRVCQQSLALFDMTLDDVIEGVEILGATSIIDLSLQADHVMYF